MLESAFEIKNTVFGYDKKVEIIHGINASIPKGEITALIGPNGCGKTTTFGILSKTFKPWSGDVLFYGKQLVEYDRKEYAKRVSVVHQYNTVPDDMTVKNLVAVGRTPYHNTLFSHESQDDKKIIAEAMEFTGVAEFADRQVKELSGGQMQRVWLSLALAQSRETLLLDEITTYLDIRYQYEILNLIRQLNETFKTTVIMVLHDINQTMQFSDNTIIMKNGNIVCQGRTEDVITESSIKDTYGIDAEIKTVGESKICLFSKK
ncbi:MAG: ABC transporter ATP-binding protein [Clostridiales bacterium]|nr:ABC transporter ATP-binding protein [Clostridiales bacterium]